MDTPGNRVEVCPTTHRQIHRLIDAYVVAGGEPAGAVLRNYNELTRRLALMAWDQRPPNPTRTSLA